MKSISLLFLVLLTFNSASPVHSLRQTPPAGLQDFLDGLVQGLELNSNSPGACSTDLINANDEIMAVVADAQKIIAGDETYLLKLISDAGQVVDILEASNADCQWTTLIDEIKGLGTAAGRTQILGNIINNIGSITSYAEQIPDCPTNWAICGYNVAQIFSLIFNWKITVPLTQTTGFFSGFVSGIETPGSDGSCVTDMDSLAGLADSIEADVQKALTGNIAAAIEAFTDIKQLLSEAKGFNGDCNLSGLLTAIESLDSPAGWSAVVTNVMSNFGTISSAAAAFNSCSSNPAACGFSLGEILRLSLGWSLGPASLRTNPAASWFDGLLQGLQTSPNADDTCVSDLNGFAPQVQTIVNEVKDIVATKNIAEIMTVIADVKELLASVGSAAAPCNLGQLISTLKSLSTPQGVTYLMNNVKANFGAIATNVPAVLSCSSNVTGCGESVGVIVRLALNWSI